MIKRANVNYCKNLFRKYADYYRPPTAFYGYDANNGVAGSVLGATLLPGMTAPLGALAGLMYSAVRKKTKEEQKHKIKTLFKDILFGGGIGGALGAGIGAIGGSIAGRNDTMDVITSLHPYGRD